MISLHWGQSGGQSAPTRFGASNNSKLSSSRTVQTTGSLSLRPGRCYSSTRCRTQKTSWRGSALGNGLGSLKVSRKRRQSVRVEALFESFTENSITSILLAQGFARDMHSAEVRWFSALPDDFEIRDRQFRPTRLTRPPHPLSRTDVPRARAPWADGAGRRAKRVPRVWGGCGSGPDDAAQQDGSHEYERGGLGRRATGLALLGCDEGHVPESADREPPSRNVVRDAGAPVHGTGRLDVAVRASRAEHVPGRRRCAQGGGSPSPAQGGEGGTEEGCRGQRWPRLWGGLWPG